MIMRKILMAGLIMVITLPAFNLAAQRETGISYRNRNLIGAGFTLIPYGYGHIGTRSIDFPPLSLYLETGLHDNITAGPFVGYATYDYSHTDFAEPFLYSFSITSAGVRSSLHITRFLNNIFGFDVNENRTDWYVTLLLGMEYRRFTSATQTYADHYTNEFNLLFGPMGGVRYYLGNNFAFYLEAGRGNLGIIAAGLSVRL
jgi:hypothetical protein